MDSGERGFTLPEAGWLQGAVRHLSVAVQDSTGPLRHAPLTINLFSITLTFGLLIKINFVSVLFVLLVFVYFRWWFL